MYREHRYVVIGAGDVGAAVAYRLARAAGRSVLVLDALRPWTDRKRTPRPAHLVHPEEATSGLPATAAHETWRELERLSGQSVLHETGGLVVADRDGPQVGRHAAVADRQGLDFEVLDARGVARRWPRFRLVESEHAFVQRRAGILDTARGAAVHLALARGHGARVRGDTPVRALRPCATHVEVVLDEETVRAEHVVVAAGAGTNTVLAGVRTLPLTTTTDQTGLFATPDLLAFSPDRFPVFSWYGWQGARGGAAFSGIGVHGEVATALTQHSGVLDPAVRREFLTARVPGFAGAEVEQDTRTHTGTGLPDGGIVLDTVPEAPRVSVVVGSGRHATFAGLFGRVLAELVLTGRSRRCLDAFALDRGALVDAGTPSG